MTITLDLKPKVEAELKAQAQAAGLSLAQFLSRELDAIAPAAPARFPETPEVRSDQAESGQAGFDSVGSDEWERGFDEWLDSFPQHPVLSEDAVKRENWYLEP